MAQAHAGVNGSGKSKAISSTTAYTGGAEVIAPAEPQVPAEEIQDSSNATV